MDLITKDRYLKALKIHQLHDYRLQNDLISFLHAILRVTAVLNFAQVFLKFLECHQINRY